MKSIFALACGVTLACAAFAALHLTGAAQTPSASPTAAASPLPSPPLVAPRRVIVENPQSSFFPSVDQMTGSWQGCGPEKSQGNLDDFSRAHPRARIVQVFIDASIPCKPAGAHTFLIVYQEASQAVRRSTRQPMGR